MLPLIREKRDNPKIVRKTGRCKKYDVVLFKRKTGAYVLHRIVKVRKNTYDLCGDNQVNVEHNITDDMIIGVLDGVFRDDKYVSVTDAKYIEYSKLVVRSRVRRKIRYYFRKALKKLKIKK